MKRVSAVLGILGLTWAATMPALAQGTIELFGKTYNLVRESRAQTYKNGLRVVLPPRDLSLQLASLNFVEGADPSQDRLFVGSNIVANEEVRAHQFYLLTGADANGVFTKDSAALTEYFGGAQNLNRGGRPTGHIWLNDLDTGVKQDRNIAISTYTGADVYRLFDFDSMNGVAAVADEDATTQQTDQVFGIFNGDEEANPPGVSYSSYARFPQWDGHTVVVFAQNSGGTGVTVWDTRRNAMFPIVTNLQEVTADSTTPYPEDVTQVYGAFHHSGNEYWVLAGVGDYTNPDTIPESVRIVRLQLTFPSDMTQEAPGSIRAQVLGISQELQGSVLHGMTNGAGGLYGMTKGREVATGLFRLYFGDSEGNITTATPQP
jgi:hypothetical protein